jgi:proteasome lid subunit RPN8/RPN11
LNGDEITFGDIKVREPQRQARPDRDRRFACVAYEVPGPVDLPIFLDRRSADAIERHALSDTSVELGGILLGKECLDPATGEAFVWVNQSLEAKHYANTQASFTYTHDSWEEITRERDARFPQYDIVGWYHTHPNFGIFLSHHDLFIHHNFFSQALQVAYVVDPINQTRGFFQWRDGGMAQVAGYFLTADRGDRIALARLANDLENLPNTEGGSGGAFSPRLEAELIKMLTRPGQREISSPVDRLQAATFYGMLGMFLGVMGLATVLWLGQQLGKIQATNESVQTLAHAIEKLDTRERIVSDALMDRAGKDPVDFAGLYERALKAKDEAEKRLGNSVVSREILEDDAKQKKADIKRLSAELTKSKEQLEKAEKEARLAAELNAQVEELGKDKAALQGKLKELEPWLESDLGKAAEATRRDLALTRYMMYGGWGLSVLLGLSLAASYFLLKPLPAAPLEGDGGAEAGTDAERPTHRIE